MDSYRYICTLLSIYCIMVDPNYITNVEIMTTLAKRVKEYRLAARLSQRELAQQSGVSYTTISHFEQGRNTNLTLSNFISLLRCVGMEKQLLDLLPELPVPPMALRQINKLIPKRIKKSQHDSKS